MRPLNCNTENLFSPQNVIVGSVSWQKVALRLGRAESERQDVGGAL